MIQSVTTPDGVSIGYRVDGPEHGVPLLLCHSIGTTLDVWASQVDRFARTFRTVRYDARGHGGSSAPPGEYTIGDLGRDAITVLEAVDAGPAHIVGISMGGLTAMWLAVHAPDRVRSLVLANTAARLGTRARWTERIATVHADGMAAIAEMAVPVWFSPPFREAHSGTVDAVRRMVASCSPEGYAGCCSVLREADLREDIGRIGVPTLIIAGAADEATPPADADEMCARIPRATIVTLDAAHLSNVEQPDRFTHHVEAFLSSSTDHVHA